MSKTSVELRPLEIAKANTMADREFSMAEQKSTDVLLMELMSLALGWEFEGSSEHRALVKNLYQAAQEERKVADCRFLRMQEKQASSEREMDSLRAKLAHAEAAMKVVPCAERGKQTLNETEKEGGNGGTSGFLVFGRTLLTM